MRSFNLRYNVAGSQEIVLIPLSKAMGNGLRRGVCAAVISSQILILVFAAPRTEKQGWAGPPRLARAHW